jgi:protein SCO1
MTLRRAGRVAALAAGLVVLAAGLAACSSSGGPAATFSQVGGSAETDAHYPGALVFPDAYRKPDVALTDTEDQPYNIARATKGRVTLVYFGYTHCPDLCPLNMYIASDAVKSLPASVRPHIQVVFVTTDPDRDTPSVIATWLAHFDSSFVGLTGPITTIQTIEKSIGMPLSEAEKAPEPGANYEIVHAGYILVYTQDGLAHLEFPAQILPRQEAGDLQSLVEHGWQST